LTFCLRRISADRRNQRRRSVPPMALWLSVKKHSSPHSFFATYLFDLLRGGRNDGDVDILFSLHYSFFPVCIGIKEFIKSAGPRSVTLVAPPPTSPLSSVAYILAAGATAPDSVLFDFPLFRGGPVEFRTAVPRVLTSLSNPTFDAAISASPASGPPGEAPLLSNLRPTDSPAGECNEEDVFSSMISLKGLSIRACRVLTSHRHQLESPPWPLFLPVSQLG